MYDWDKLPADPPYVDYSGCNSYVVYFLSLGKIERGTRDL